MYLCIIVSVRSGLELEGGKYNLLGVKEKKSVESFHYDGKTNECKCS